MEGRWAKRSTIPDYTKLQERTMSDPDLIDEYVQLKSKIAPLEKRAKELRLALIGAGPGNYRGWQEAVTIQEHSKVVLDRAALARDYPDLVERYGWIQKSLWVLVGTRDYSPKEAEPIKAGTRSKPKPWTVTPLAQYPVLAHESEQEYIARVHDLLGMA
jgi:hypothetical protein